MLTADQVSPTVVPGQWWACVNPLRLMHITEVDSGSGWILADFWSLTESQEPGSLAGVAPNVSRFLWYRQTFWLDENPKCRLTRIGEVRICPGTGRLMFISEVKDYVEVRADWKVTQEDLARSEVFQAAPSDPLPKEPTIYDKLMQDTSS